MERPTIKLLLIDDDPDINLLVKSILKNPVRNTYELTWTSSYDKGLALSISGSFDAILQDYYLSNDTLGPDLVIEAQNMGCKIPFIMLTSNDEKGIDIEAVKLGVMDYILKKNLNLDLLEKSILYAIERNKYRLKIEEDKNKYKSISSDFGEFFSEIRADLVDQLTELETAFSDFIEKSPNLEKTAELKRLKNAHKNLTFTTRSLKKLDI